MVIYNGIDLDIFHPYKNDFFGHQHSKGKKITTLAELSLKISDCNKSDYPFVFKFDDAYIECRHFGLVKILEVTCDFESEDQKMTIDIDAGNFVKAILKDTFSAKTEFVVMR